VTFNIAKIKTLHSQV